MRIKPSSLLKAASLSFRTLLLLAVPMLAVSARAQSVTLLPSNALQLTYTGSDGTLQYQWVPPAYGAYNSIGSVLVTSNLTGSSQTSFGMQASAMSNLGTTHVQSATWSVVNGANKLTILLTAGSTSSYITITPTLAGKTLSLSINSNNGIYRLLGFSSWPSSLQQQLISVPYDSEQPVYFPSANLFANMDFDWTVSNGAMGSYNQSRYPTLTDGSTNPIQEIVRLSVSENIGDTFPSIPNAPSPYLAEMSGKMVVDLSGGAFAPISKGFFGLQQMGVKGCLGIIHGWQNAGYDNELPLTFPANAADGGSAGISKLTASATAANCLISLHENYADYYPNYPQFDTAALSLDSTGAPIKAWMNSSTGIQAYATKQTWMSKTAGTQSAMIHQSYHTTAAYLDVNSASNDYSRLDYDATQPGAGTASGWVYNTAKLFQKERDTHAGPVMGEGGLAGWIYSGLLDGVEANPGGTSGPGLGETLPLFVDFDLLRIHPLQVNEGMGRYSRWLQTGESIYSYTVMDAYRMQEIAYGHAPYIQDAYWNNTAYAIQEQALVSPVAQRYGTQTVNSIQYKVGGAWSNTTAAILANDFSQVQVAYSNGDTIVANSQPANLSWNGLTIPQYGWAAQGTDMLAYTALNNGSVVDYAQTPTSYFANARNQGDYQLQGLAVAAVAAVKLTAPKVLSMQIQWNVLQQSSGVDNVFIHFINETGSLSFQAGYAPATATTNWTLGAAITDAPVRVTIPSNVPDGIYSVRIGLADTNGGTREILSGLNDGGNRYILGNLTLANSGSTVSFSPQAAPVSDPRLNANPGVVDFGTIKTDGMIRMQQATSGSNTTWNLRAFPPTRNVQVLFNSADIPAPSTVTCDTGQVLTPTVSGAYWTVPTQGTGVCSWPAL